MAEKEKTENLDKSNSRTEPSEAASLDELRGRGKHNVFMETSDFENAIMDDPGENKQETREVANAEEEGKGEAKGSAEEETTEKDGEPLTDEQAVEVDAATDELQKKLFASDTDRAKLRQDIAEQKKRIGELGPVLDLGYAISQDPELLRAVRTRLAGGNKGQQAAAGAKPTSAQFMNAMRTMMREEVGTAIGTHVEANRRLNTYDAKAKKELSNFDLISKHPNYMEHLTVWNTLIRDGNVDVPAEYADEPEFYAMKQAHTTMLQGNPDYQAAAKGAATKTAKANLEKKALAASIGGGSKTANVGERKLTTDESDRIGMLKAYKGYGRSRRIPGARTD